MAEESTPPLGTDNPTVATNPGQSAPLPYEPIEGDTTNNPPIDSLLSWGSKENAAAFIKVNDILPPNGSKRYQRYISLYVETDNISSVRIEFKGAKPGIGSTQDMVEKPALAEALEKLHQMSEAKGAMVIDSQYEIKLLSLQSTRVDADHPGQTSTFTFNNGSYHEVNFPSVSAKNAHLAFDVINTMSSMGCIVRFDVKVVVVKKN